MRISGHCSNYDDNNNIELSTIVLCYSSLKPKNAAKFLSLTE